MPHLASAFLPKRYPHGPHEPSAHAWVSPTLVQVATQATDEALATLRSAPTGLAAAEAQRRLGEVGPNVVARDETHARLRLLGRALLNPLVVLLLTLAAFSLLTGDARSAAVMLLMVVLGLVLRFVQESRASDAAARLRAMIRVHATVLRDGRPTELPIGQLVPGDVVELAAGDMIPADLRLLNCKDLFVTQSLLTGEPFATEKFAAGTPSRGAASPLELANVCYLGTSVESGTARAVVAATGLNTFLGGMSQTLAARPAPTSFDRGVSQFTWLMIGLIAVMVPLVFVINGWTKGDWGQALFFALAVAVGLTPEMLPMIVTVCLTKGALAMAGKRVIVKRLNSIQNLGGMDVLCTDKTGTLTMNQIILEKHCDVRLETDPEVLRLAYLNSHFQTGLKNLLDVAILRHVELHEHVQAPECAKIDEIPFDFSRKMMSVVVRMPDGRARLICKGAPEDVFQRCASFVLDGRSQPIARLGEAELREKLDQLSAEGFRVLALAYRDLESQTAYSKEDEQQLVLRGYVAFLDPPKDSARSAIAALLQRGVAVKVLTGDNELVSRKICGEVGIVVERVLLGSQVDALADAQLADEARATTLFARISPAGKQRVIKALRGAGHVVGFLGDGINDAPALRAADVGISVDTAVDIAKESADAILLEKDLGVVADGVCEGRRVFANVLKYIRMGASSNFGNMLSVLGASVFLPFVPMMPLQILTNNLLYDVSQIPIPTDRVDPEQIARPRPWSIAAIWRYIVLIGPCSSVFDYATFFVLLTVFGCWDPARQAMFQSGWFVESLLTQTLIIHIIRTNRIPWLQSRASWPLLATTALVAAVGICLPGSPLGPAFGFAPLPPLFWPILVGIVVGYVLLTQGVKTWLVRRTDMGE